MGDVLKTARFTSDESFQANAIILNEPLGTKRFYEIVVDLLQPKSEDLSDIDISFIIDHKNDNGLIHRTVYPSLEPVTKFPFECPTRSSNDDGTTKVIRITVSVKRNNKPFDIGLGFTLIEFVQNA